MEPGCKCCLWESHSNTSPSSRAPSTTQNRPPSPPPTPKGARGALGPGSLDHERFSHAPKGPQRRASAKLKLRTPKTPHSLKRTPCFETPIIPKSRSKPHPIARGGREDLVTPLDLHAFPHINPNASFHCNRKVNRGVKGGLLTARRQIASGSKAASPLGRTGCDARHRARLQQSLSKENQGEGLLHPLGQPWASATKGPGHPQIPQAMRNRGWANQDWPKGAGGVSSSPPRATSPGGRLP